MMAWPIFALWLLFAVAAVAVVCVVFHGADPRREAGQ